MVFRSNMELSKGHAKKVQEMVVTKVRPQPKRTVVINREGGLVVADCGQEFGLVPVPTTGERLLIMDGNGVLREVFSTDVSYLVSSHNLPILADDTEIPPHVLDHMYAKKPREPGTETAPTKPRRRVKRKDQVVEQFLLPEAQPSAPKINIIRQRLPSTAVYKSLPNNKPKILHGGSGLQKSASSSSSIVTSSNNSSNKGKATTSQTKASVHVGRTNKKDDSSKTMYASFEEVNKLFNFGGGNKGGKEGKSQKNYASKSNGGHNAIMDDLQRVGAAYDEEMLFDFGIAEDESINPLGADGFSDGEFDEFGVGMEVDSPNANQPGLKSSSLSKSCPKNTYTSGGNSRSAPLLPHLPPDISDDDDSNQIMVPMQTRRPSHDWESSQFSESSLKPESDTSQSSSDACIKRSSFSMGSEAGNKKAKVEKVDSLEPSNFNTKALQGAQEPQSPSPPPSHQNSQSVDAIPRRRSSRVVKTPAWLEDSDKIPIAKRQRKKSAA